MHDFISFLERRDGDLWLSHYETISEMSMAEIEARKPKDGEWLKDDVYGFNVEGDECQDYELPIDYDNFPNKLKQCYIVSFSGGSKTSVSFNRGTRGYNDERRGVGNQVFMGVQYAIMEFIKKRNPNYLKWEPIKTTTSNPVTGAVRNPEGRRDAYEIFAIKSLLPMYVSVNVNEWMRRDIYEAFYVTKGYPSIPENLTTSSSSVEKKNFLQSIRNAHAEEENKKQKELEDSDPYWARVRQNREEEEERNREDYLANLARVRQNREEEESNNRLRAELGDEEFRRQREEEETRRGREEFHRGLDAQRFQSIRRLRIAPISPYRLKTAGVFNIGDTVFTSVTPRNVNRSYGKNLYNEPNSIAQLQAAMQDFNTKTLKINKFLADGDPPGGIFGDPRDDNREAKYAEVYLMDSSNRNVMTMYFHLKDLSKNEIIKK